MTALLEITICTSSQAASKNLADLYAKTYDTERIERSNRDPVKKKKIELMFKIFLRFASIFLLTEKLNI